MKLCPLIVSRETARVSNARFDSEIHQSTKLSQYTVGTNEQTSEQSSRPDIHNFINF